MPGTNPIMEAWIANQLSLFWSYIANYEIECAVEDPQTVQQQLIDELRRIAYEEAMDDYLACKAREVGVSLYAGFPVDLGCVAP